jgi:hypothetical protein
MTRIHILDLGRKSADNNSKLLSSLRQVLLNDRDQQSSSATRPQG